jgi:tape measure domain-containing protein
MDTKEFQKGADSLGSIVKGLVVFKLLEKGFQLVTASIDQAVARYDTLNKFPKVLEQMGFSAEQSGAATKKLAAGVQGLPTSLDEIVASAQKLTVLSGNLESSVDTTLALNNAFLASGSSAADASRGLTQYTQMLATGKVDVISWRTLQETMGFALQKTAEAFGYAGQSAQNDLYAALRDGDVTFEQFNAKLAELDQGVGGFAEMAKTSTGGIATAMANLRTRTVAGVTDIIAAIDRGFSQTRFKSIENIINSTGKIMKSVLSGVASAFEFAAKNIVPLAAGIASLAAAWKAVQLLSYTAQLGSLTAAMQKMLPAIATLSVAKIKDAAETAYLTALYANDTVVKLLNEAASKNLAVAYAKDTAVKLLSAAASKTAALAQQADTAAAFGGVGAKIAQAAATGLATAAQWAWNVAMTANPIGLMIVAIAALIAGLVALVSWLGSNSQAYKEGKQYIKDYEAANEELASSLKESTDSFNDNSNAAEANANMSRDMLAGLQDLAGKGLGRTAEETYQLQAKIDALNAAQEGLNLAIDETTGGLKMAATGAEATASEIEAFIKITESAARATALGDHMKALEGQMVEVEAQFISAERQIAEWDKQVESGELDTKKYDKLVSDLSEGMEELEVTQGEILSEMAQNNTEYGKMLADQQAQQDALLAMQEDEIREYAALHHLSYDEMMADMAENNLSFSAWQTANQETIDKGQEAIAGFAEKWGLSLDDVNASISASGMGIEAYVEQQDAALEHAKDVVSDYTASVTDGFSAMEQESAISLSNFMENMRKNEEATANWAANMNTLMDLGINQGVIAQLSAMGPEGAAQAQAFVDELTAMNGGVDLALGETNEVVTAKLAEIDGTFGASLETASAAADTQLRAESYYESGYASIDKIATGITANTAATEAATQAGADIGESFNTAAGSVDLSATGQAIGDSFAAGITTAVQNGASGVTSAATAMGASVQTAFQSMSTQAQSTAAQMMTQINSAVVTRSGTVKASVTSMCNGIVAALGTAKTQGVSIATQMMSGVNSAVSAGAATATATATALSNGVVAALQPMAPGAAGVANNMMDGMLTAMNNKAGALYAKAAEIASNIANTMADALEVKSPSRVMIHLFENVMMGIYEGMDGMAGMLYNAAEDIADGLAERLAIDPDALASMADGMRAMTESSHLGGAALAGAGAAYGAGAGVAHVTSLTQNITTPKPLSASEMTREGQDMLRRSRWQLP